MNNQIQEELKEVHLALKGVSGLLAQDADNADSKAIRRWHTDRQPVERNRGQMLMRPGADDRESLLRLAPTPERGSQQLAANFLCALCVLCGSKGLFSRVVVNFKVMMGHSTAR